MTDLKRYAQGLRTKKATRYWTRMSVSYYPYSHNEETDFALHILHKMKDCILEYVRPVVKEDEFLYINKLYLSWNHYGVEYTSAAVSSLIMACEEKLNKQTMEKMLQKLADMIDDIANGEKP